MQMIKAEDEFWRLFVNPPCYDISPWESITKNERNELMMILNWVLHSDKLIMDAYEVILNKNQHKKFKHYMSGEHALNYHLKNDLNFKKPLTYKSIDIHFKLDNEFKPATYLSQDQIQDLIYAQKINLGRACKGYFRNHPLFFELASDCSTYVESVAYTLCDVLKKHQTFIKSKLAMMKLELIRATVLRDSDVLHLPLKKSCFRVGLEINNAQKNEVFFWSIFTLRIDWKEALMGKSFDTENVTMINLLPPNAPIAPIVTQDLPVISFKEIRKFMADFDDFPKTQDKHYDSIFSNPNNNFMKKRHKYLRDLFTWCSKNLSGGQELSINEIETSLDTVKEAEKIESKREDDNDYWYLEYQDFEYDRANDILKIKTVRDEVVKIEDESVSVETVVKMSEEMKDEVVITSDIRETEPIVKDNKESKAIKEGNIEEAEFKSTLDNKNVQKEVVEVVPLRVISKVSSIEDVITVHKELQAEKNEQNENDEVAVKDTPISKLSEVSSVEDTINVPKDYVFDYTDDVEGQPLKSTIEAKETSEDNESEVKTNQNVMTRLVTKFHTLRNHSACLLNCGGLLSFQNV